MSSVCPEGGPPPEYQAVVAPGHRIGPRGTTQPGNVFIPMDEPPPDYEVATTLPTYEQSEMAKEKDLIVDCGQRDESNRDVGPDHSDWDSPVSEPDAALLGNDFVFFTAFITSFFFNWVGFLLLMCFCHTIAARYGALAGFGLSLAKWTLIVKRSTDLVKNENAWLWWLVLGFGFLIFARACIQYLQIKRTWRQLSVSARERLFFFY